MHDTAEFHHENFWSGALRFMRETLSMVISFNVFIVRHELNTRTNVGWNQMLYYSSKPFLHIQVSRHRTICMPSKGTVMNGAHFIGSRNKLKNLGKDLDFTLYIFLNFSTKPKQKYCGLLMSAFVTSLVLWLCFMENLVLEAYLCFQQHNLKYIYEVL